MSEKTRIDTGSPTKLDQSGGKTRLDRTGATQSSSGSQVLPSKLAAQYRVVSAFQTLGAEADLYLVERMGESASYVLKLYRRGLKPKTEVLEAIRKCDRQHVVKTIDSGESDGLWYEILEYSAHGTLRDLFPKGDITEQKMLEIVRELAKAIDHIHKRKIIHRDLKPENVLVRSTTPLDLVLTDFGIASLNEATQHFTTKSRTIKYGAPEAAAGAVGNASDYWSLGLIVLEGMTGKHPFDGLSDLAIAIQLATSKIDTSGVKSARWRALCQGLLTRDPKVRWGASQMMAWLDGKMPPLPAEEAERPSQKPYKILNRECWTAAELALELGRNWSDGEKHLARGLVLPWLREELRDQDAANLIIDLTEKPELTNEDRLLRLIVGLGKGLPPIWRGLSLDQNTLTSCCQDAINGDVDKSNLLSELYEKGVLEVWGSGGNQDCAQWQRDWVKAANAFPRMWKEVLDQVDFTKAPPDKKSFLPVLLVLVLSPKYRARIESKISAASEEIIRCHWIESILTDQSEGALLIKYSLLDEAVAAGKAEIVAAMELPRELERLEEEFRHVLSIQTDLASEVASLKNAVQENRALNTLRAALPELRTKIFNASRIQLVTQSFRRMNRWFWVEMCADGFVMAAAVLLIRFYLGTSVADDGLGIITGRLSASDDTLYSSKSYAFLIFCVVAILSFSVGALSRRVAQKFFVATTK